MDAIGVVAEARNIAQSIARRIENYRQGRKVIMILRSHLALLTERIEEVNRLFRKFPGALPDDVAVCSTELWNVLEAVYPTWMKLCKMSLQKRSKTRSGSFVEFLKSKGVSSAPS